MSEDAHAPLRRVAADRYSEFELVGKGGMGVVYLALDSELNRRVAFKIVLPEAEEGTATGAPSTPLEATPPSRTETGSGRSFGELKARFLQEAWVTSGMEHPGIVPVYELGETGEGVPYYTMRYVRGERTMKEAIAATEELDDRLFLLEPFLKVCDTIRYAHARGVVHRDLKPENIAIGEFGEVIVLDWGLAKVEGRPDVTTGRWQERIEAYRDATDLKTVAGALGTPGFMAPEAALGRSDEVDTKSDVYSLGALLFQILTGRLPFEFTTFLEYINTVMKEEPPRADEIDASIPRELADACARALSREREGRFDHVDDLARAVRVWQTEGPIEREIRALLDEARDEVEASRELEGNILLLHLDRATAALNRILHLKQGHAAAVQLQARVKRMRERGIRRRVRTDRLVVLQRVAAGLLSIGAIVALVVFSMLNQQRRAADKDQRDAQMRIEAAERRSEQAEARAQRADARVGAAHAAMARSLLEENQHGAARVVSATGLARTDSPGMWGLLADCESRWCPKLVMAAHGVRVQALHVSGDGGVRLVVGDDEGRVHVAERTGANWRVRHWIALDSAVTVVEPIAGANGFAVAAGGADGRIAILEGDGGQPGRTVPLDLPPAPESVAFGDDTLYRGTAVTALAAGPVDGSLLAGYADGRIRLFDADGTVRFVARHHAAEVRALALRGGVLMSGSRDGSINVLRTAGLILRDTWSGDPERPVAGLRFTGNDGFEAWSMDGTMWARSSGDGAPEARVIARDPEAHGVALLDGGQVLATASGPRGELRFVSTEDGTLLARGRGADSPVAAVAGSRDAALLAVAREDGSIRVWEAGPGLAVHAPGAVHGASRRTAHARADGSIEVFAIPAADPVVLKSEDGDPVSALAFEDEGSRLLSVTLTGRILVWDAATARLVRRLRASETPFTAVAWAQGEGRLLTGDLNGAVRLWPWASGQPLTFEPRASEPITIVTPESPSLRVAAADAGGSVHLWDSVTRTRRARWDDLGRLVALALSPTDERMAAVRGDGTLLRFDGEAWTEAGRLPVGSRPIELVLRADGRVAWVDQHGSAGLDDRYLGGEPITPRALGPAWALIEPAERVAELSEALGISLDDDFAVRLTPPARVSGAIDLARRG